MKIEKVTSDNFEMVLPLIEGYQEFYRTKGDRERNQRHFAKYIHDNREGVLFVAIGDDGTARGFATIYYMPSSVQAGVRCVFNDLYTLPGERGAGVGVALALHVFQYAKQKGYKAIEWETEKDNLKAQRMYDYTDAKKSNWIHYQLSLEGLPAAALGDSSSFDSE